MVDKQDVYSRREFFKKACGKVLPAICLTVSSYHLLGCMSSKVIEHKTDSKLQNSTSPASCNSGCQASCRGLCRIGCGGSAKGSCEGCSTSCKHTCPGACYNACGGSCKGRSNNMTSRSLYKNRDICKYELQINNSNLL